MRRAQSVGDPQGLSGAWLFPSAFRSYRTISPASWPGLSRPSTSFWLRARKKDVDARDERGHDEGEAIRSHRNALLRVEHNRRFPPALTLANRKLMMRTRFDILARPCGHRRN